MEPPAGEPVPLAASIDRWRRLVGAAGTDTMAAIRDAWAEIAGPLADDCSPVSLVGGVLSVSVAEPAVAEAVRWRSADWIRQLRAVVGNGSVERIEARLSR